MTKEMEYQNSAYTGSTLYYQVRDSIGRIWNTSGTPAFEAYATANIANYKIAATEAGTASGYFTADFPSAIPAGVYSFSIKKQAGGSPAESDPDIGTCSGPFQWTGSAQAVLLIAGSNAATTFAALTCAGSFTISDGLLVSRSTGNSSAIVATGTGSGSGFSGTGGATGHGQLLTGGATSGDGMRSWAGLSGHGLNLSGGTNAGNGLSASAVTGRGASFLASSGYPGILVQGAGTGDGIDIISGTGAGADGIYVGSQAASGGAGIYVATLAGDAIQLVPVAGHGINATANGTNKHGILATGGTAGTSDGIKAVAGTGGVDIRGNITGNLAGTVSTLTTYTGNTPQTGDAYARLGTPAGASISVDVAAVKSDSGAIKTQTDKLAFTVANQIDANVLDWKSAIAPAMSGDAFAYLGTNVGALGANLSAIPKAGYKLASDGLVAVTAWTVDINGHWIGTVDTVTTLTNKTGFSLTAAYDAAKTAGDATLANQTTINTNVLTRLPTSSYTAPDNAGIAAVKAKTDQLAFTTPNVLDANILYVHNIQIDGSGTTLDPWGPV